MHQATSSPTTPAADAEDWQIRRDAFYAVKAACEADWTDELSDAHSTAREACPPPTLGALVEMMRETLNPIGLERGDIDDPSVVREVMAGDQMYQKMAVRLYLHAARLAGIASPSLAEPPHRPLGPWWADMAQRREAFDAKSHPEEAVNAFRDAWAAEQHAFIEAPIRSIGDAIAKLDCAAAMSRWDLLDDGLEREAVGEVADYLRTEVGQLAASASC